MELSKLEVGKTYSRQFSNKPLIKVIAIKNNEFEIELFKEDGSTTIRNNTDHFTLSMLCYREYDPELKTIPYDGEISKDDVNCMQECFKEIITEQMIRDAISANNWGGDYTSNLNEYGIEGDSDNRDSVAGMIKKHFDFKYEWE